MSLKRMNPAQLKTLNIIDFQRQAVAVIDKVDNESGRQDAKAHISNQSNSNLKGKK